MRARSLAARIATIAALALLAASLGALAAAASPRSERATGKLTTSTTTGRGDNAPRLKPETVAAIRRGLSIRQAASTHAASAKTVTISDFKFAPNSLTVNVGDTVKWTNQGPTGHSATSDSGAFDSKVLNKGVSFSYTFKNAGTFAYHCSPHPFMKATITVASNSSGGGSGSGGSSSGGGSGSSSSSSSPSAGSASSGGSSSPLPHTGLQILSLVITGLSLIGLGVVLRRGVRYPSDWTG